jgi:ABC-2 type transport system ATP-binding protein
MIETRQLHKHFGTKVAVASLDLEIAEGEFFCFLGPNGAGKTTTIKMLTGLLHPSGGTARIGGHDIQEEPVAAKRLLGYIPDHPFLYDRLTGREQMELVAGLYRMPKDGLEARMAELLERFELSHAADQLVGDYSHGMRQKLSFASTFFHDPKVVVVDEPWVGLDPKNIRAVKGYLKERTREGVTVFMSTHSLSIAEEVADRVGIFHRGKLLQMGTVAEIKALARHPGSLEDVFLELTASEEEDAVLAGSAVP